MKSPDSHMLRTKTNLEFVLVVVDEKDVVVAPWDIGSLGNFAVSELLDLVVGDLNGVPAAVGGDLALLGVERAAASVLVTLAGRPYK